MQINKNRGVFSIEMAFVLIGMSACLYFCFDLGYQQIRKSQLERVSYSLVSVLKERTLFYQQKQPVDGKQVAQLHKIAARLLNTSPERVAINVDYRIGKTQRINQSQRHGFTCESQGKLNQKFDVALEKTGEFAPVYQVTVCQKIPAWFERVIGKDIDNDERVIKAQSTFMGR
ncbi:tight adherence pilus pseudopilin TadF [Vibrio sp. SCSIO 43136]|uniref:tight adherence pilus pseudopilin TadF n=1 Tax=Vibrio sp. SCSIO 43136 TaxID=2819101 RepID=UPI002075D3AF|nr:tight adherence pilus pseudopilin TadF [Vibrio sp. SCSIO 43136]USD67751.1 hypothetical protein J4N39_16315 [Vibrio sp. SCSIO 43136]